MGSDLPREDSAIINRLVIDDPSEDLERERARVAETGYAHAAPAVAPAAGLGLVGSEGAEDVAPVQQRSRQEHLRNSQPRREVKFGDYILGQTIGEGEFGKVKLGWKKEGVQVAIKLIRREVLGNNPNRLPKIYREIAILRGLQHPNIVRLHEMVETERHIGIILEYASGGELFDFILNHRYLKDNAARRLFAQLISGVGYLHKRGIVHRDLKLENLLLDRNKNIIITDFGFANTFNPNDELGEEVENCLVQKDFVQRYGLDQIQQDGHRRGDLMQTSCGSPCYAAPELVVSDSLYTGRKVDVWSCGVILVRHTQLLIRDLANASQYAMLAGYLPFDDDPANPEGDNINLLYKYIVSTPLTFPEYVTPHARDLLRRILVPDPRKRADLFEVARHSWLAEYAHVVSFITSSADATADAQQNMVPAEQLDVAGLNRSASVREPVKHQSMAMPSTGRVASQSDQEERARRDRDAKRRTVQLEYVAPSTQTARVSPVATPVEQPTPANAPQAKTRARGDSANRPVEIAPTPEQTAAPPRTQNRPPTQGAMAAPSRPAREPTRAISDSSAFVGTPTSPVPRPTTRGSVNGQSRLPSRGNSYGQPSAAEVAVHNVEGRFAQPAKSGYIISGPLSPGGRDPSTGRPLSQQFPADFEARPSMDAPERPRHRRTSTMESFTSKLFGRSNSTARRQSQQQLDPEAVQPAQPAQSRPKKDRAYPPVSMKNAVSNDAEALPRPSTDSRRSSFGFNRRDSEEPNKRASKRFSFLPSAFSRMSLSGSKDEPAYDNKRSSVHIQPPRSRHDSKAPTGMAFGQGRSRSPSAETTGSTINVLYDSNIDPPRRKPVAQPQGMQRGATAPDLLNYPPAQSPYAGYSPRQQDNQFHSPSQSQETHSTDHSTSGQYQPHRPQYPPGFEQKSEPQGRPQQRPQASGIKNKNRKFDEAYEQSGHGGSSGGARRVMDWFRKRGRERAA